MWTRRYKIQKRNSRSYKSKILRKSIKPGPRVRLSLLQVEEGNDCVSESTHMDECLLLCGDNVSGVG